MLCKCNNQVQEAKMYFPEIVKRTILDLLTLKHKQKKLLKILQLKLNKIVKNLTFVEEQLNKMKNY